MVIMNLKEKSIIKPIAYKPSLLPTIAVNDNFKYRFGTPTVRFTPIDNAIDNANEVANMNKITSKSSLSQSQYSLSQNSLYLEDENWYSEICVSNQTETSETPGMVSIESTDAIESYYDMTAETPSASGIAQLEAILREKDSEISYLRETLEHNEQVIFKVYEEKEQMWRRECDKLRALYVNKLRSCQQRTAKVQQHSQQRIYELETSKKQNDETKKCLENELSLTKSQLEETQWSLCQKVGEISLLKTQFKESQDDHSSRISDLVALRIQLKDAKKTAEQKSQQVLELQEKLSNSEHNSLEPLINIQKSVTSLESELVNVLRERDEKSKALESAKCENCRLQDRYTSLQNQLDLAKEEIEEERAQWLEEKEKVIRYQKQLQSNYMQMLKRNKLLESQMQQILIESKDNHNHRGNESHF